MALPYDRPMAAVLYRVRALLRAHRVSTLVLVVLIAVVSGAVMAVAAGAHRTMTAPDRYTDSVGGSFDALVTQQDGGPPVTAAIAALPSVSSAGSITFVFGAMIEPGSGEMVQGLVFGGSAEANGLQLVAGRDPAPGSSTEFVATRTFVSQAQLKVGDELQLAALTQEQADSGGFDETTASIHRPAVLVGVVDGPSQVNDPEPIALFGPDLIVDEPEMGIALTLVSVRLRPGQDLAQLRTELDGLAAGPSLSVAPSTIIGTDIRRAVQTLAVGLWLVVVVAGIAAIAVLGQLVTRHVRLGAVERSRLVAIGSTDGQIVAESSARAAIPVVIGALLGAVVATVPSSVFPAGFFRRLEPHPGFEIDVTVIPLGVLVTIVGLAAWTVGVLWIAQRPARSARPSKLVETLATRTPGSAAATGLRFAFTRRATERAAIRGPIVAIMMTVAVLVGAIVFGASMSRLMDEPARYGSNYDLAIGDDGAASLDPAVEASLRSDPEVTSLTLYAQSHGRVRSTDISLLGMQVVRGGTTPIVLEGRLPAGDDEIAFGRVSAEDVGAVVGGSVEVAGTTGVRAFAVVGLVVVPGFGANEGMGDGAIVTVGGLGLVDSETMIASAAISVRDWRSSPTASARIDSAGQERLPPPFRPSVIVNIARVRVIPYLLAILLGVLAVITVANVVLSAVRSRRRDLVVLRALGAEQSWIVRVVHWQATIFVSFCIVAGVPLGAIAGAALFTRFAESMGAVDDASLPWWWIGLVVFAAVVLANGAAALPSRQARRWIPAEVLLTE